MFILHLLLLVLPPCLANYSEHPYASTPRSQDHYNTSKFKDLPCPNAEDIAPCICTYLEDEYMNMNCTNIADEQELYNVFHAEIPFPKFMRLDLGTNNLNTLSDDVFGDATFEEVWTNQDNESGNISYVDPKTFIKSIDTLRVLYLESNELTENDFPFDTLSQYTQLTDLSFRGNPISVFPTIESETLEELYMSHDNYSMLSSGAFDHLPNLEKFVAWGNEIGAMDAELFSSLPNLTYIHMGNAGLGNLRSLQFEVNSTSMELIILNENQIRTVENNTFEGVTSGTIMLNKNLITLLPEDTWRPLIEAGVNLRLAENDLLCGCDVAWLVLEPSFHDFVADATCHDGELLVTLDTTYFENFC